MKGFFYGMPFTAAQYRQTYAFCTLIMRSDAPRRLKVEAQKLAMMVEGVIGPVNAAAPASTWGYYKGKREIPINSHAGLGVYGKIKIKRLIEKDPE